MAGNRAKIAEIQGYGDFMRFVEFLQNAEEYEKKARALENEREEINALLDQVQEEQRAAADAAGGADRIRQSHQLLEEAREKHGEANAALEEAQRRCVELEETARAQAQAQLDRIAAAKAEAEAEIAKVRDSVQKDLERSKALKASADAQVAEARELKADAEKLRGEYEEKAAKLREAMGA